jgi:copper chaperone CopZ
MRYFFPFCISLLSLSGSDWPEFCLRRPVDNQHSNREGAAMDDITKNLKIRIFGMTFPKRVTRHTRQWMMAAVLGVFFLTLPLHLPAAGLNRTVLEVKSLNCDFCLSKIGAALADLDGFAGMSADLYQREVVIDHQPTLSGSDISEAVTALGYPAKVLRETVLEPDSGAVTNQAGQGKWYSKGVGCSGCAVSHSCGGTASAWQAFYSKYFGKDRSNKDDEMIKK